MDGRLSDRSKVEVTRANENIKVNGNSELSHIR